MADNSYILECSPSRHKCCSVRFSISDLPYSGGTSGLKVWLTGENATDGLIYSWTPSGGFSVEYTDPDWYVPYAIKAFSGNDVWSMLDDKLVHYDGASWTPVSKPYSALDIEMDGLNTPILYGVGGGSGSDRLLKYDGSFTKISTGTWNPLFDVFMFSASDIWVVGDDYNENFFWHYNGSSWTAYPGKPSTYPSWGCIWGYTTDDVWAWISAGAGGLGYHWNGSSWSYDSGSNWQSYFWYDVAGISASDIMFIGYNRFSRLPYSLHYDGLTWELMEIGGDAYSFYEVHICSYQGAYYAADGTGILWSFSNDEWTELGSVDLDGYGWHGVSASGGEAPGNLSITGMSMQVGPKKGLWKGDASRRLT
jgi:hypothetical protein